MFLDNNRKEHLGVEKSFENWKISEQLRGLSFKINCMIFIYNTLKPYYNYNYYFFSENLSK